LANPVGSDYKSCQGSRAALAVNGKTTRDPQSLGLEKLKREFLGQQDISSWKVPLGEEAKPGHTLALRAELHDIQRVAVVNAIAATGSSSDDIEISMRLVILAL